MCVCGWVLTSAAKPLVRPGLLLQHVLPLALQHLPGHCPERPLVHICVVLGQEEARNSARIGQPNAGGGNCQRSPVVMAVRAADADAASGARPTSIAATAVVSIFRALQSPRARAALPKRARRLTVRGGGARPRRHHAVTTAPATPRAGRAARLHAADVAGVPGLLCSPWLRMHLCACAAASHLRTSSFKRDHDNNIIINNCTGYGFCPAEKCIQLYILKIILFRLWLKIK